MVSTLCLAHDDPNRVFSYCPSFAAAILFAALFFIVTLMHVAQAYIHRKPFCWVLIMGGCWETGGYVFRSVNITRQTDSGLFTAQLLLILLAPLWINAFIYMVIGRMIHFFLLEDRIWGIKARKITMTFVLFDIAAFMIQLSGGLMTTGTDTPMNIIKIGLKVYTGGVGLQLAFIAVFCAIGAKFDHLLRKQDSEAPNHIGIDLETSSDSQNYNTEPHSTSHQQLNTAACSKISPLRRNYICARPVLIVVWVVMALIILRNIYRLVEYAIGGVNGNIITKHEWFHYVLDAVPMFIAMITVLIYHPGRVLQGERSDFSAENKARKEEKKAKKQAKKDMKLAKKVEQKQEKASRKSSRGK